MKYFHAYLICLCILLVACVSSIQESMEERIKLSSDNNRPKCVSFSRCLPCKQ